MNEMKVARGLGWFSIGLGLTEVFAGRQLGRVLGMEDKNGLLRTFGVREVATGIAILATEQPRAGVWARVAGDCARPGRTGIRAHGGQSSAEESDRGNRGCNRNDGPGLLVCTTTPQRPAARFRSPPPRERGRRIRAALSNFRSAGRKLVTGGQCA